MALGPGTAADDYTVDVGDETDSPDDPYAVDVSAADTTDAIPDYTPVYDRGIERLKAQRSGMSSRERIGALLIGFGQPTRHGKWQESVVNGATSLYQQSLAQKTSDEKRRYELERLTNARDIAGIRTKAQIEAARIRAAAALAKGPKPVDRIQVGINPIDGTPQGFHIQMLDGKPVVTAIPIGGGESPVPIAIPEITEPDQAAQHPESPVVHTPRGLMKNPFYKGG